MKDTLAPGLALKTYKTRSPPSLFPSFDPTGCLQESSLAIIYRSEFIKKYLCSHQDTYTRPFGRHETTAAAVDGPGSPRA